MAQLANTTKVVGADAGSINPNPRANRPTIRQEVKREFQEYTKSWTNMIPLVNHKKSREIAMLFGQNKVPEIGESVDLELNWKSVLTQGLKRGRQSVTRRTRNWRVNHHINTPLDSSVIDATFYQNPETYMGKSGIPFNTEEQGEVYKTMIEHIDQTIIDTHNRVPNFVEMMPRTFGGNAIGAAGQAKDIKNDQGIRDPINRSQLYESAAAAGDSKNVIPEGLSFFIWNNLKKAQSWMDNQTLPMSMRHVLGLTDDYNAYEDSEISISNFPAQAIFNMIKTAIQGSSAGFTLHKTNQRLSHKVGTYTPANNTSLQVSQAEGSVLGEEVTIKGFLATPLAALGTYDNKNLDNEDASEDAPTPAQLSSNILFYRGDRFSFAGTKHINLRKNQVHQGDATFCVVGYAGTALGNHTVIDEHGERWTGYDQVAQNYYLRGDVAAAAVTVKVKIRSEIHDGSSTDVFTAGTVSQRHDKTVDKAPVNNTVITVYGEPGATYAVAYMWHSYAIVFAGTKLYTPMTASMAYHCTSMSINFLVTGDFEIDDLTEAFRVDARWGVDAWLYEWACVSYVRKISNAD